MGQSQLDLEEENQEEIFKTGLSLEGVSACSISSSWPCSLYILLGSCAWGHRAYRWKMHITYRKVFLAEGFDVFKGFYRRMVVTKIVYCEHRLT